MRIVIANNGHELACRMETPGALKRFVASGERQLFKGRLQLIREGDQLLVNLKNAVVGKLSVAVFEQMIGQPGLS